MKQRVLVLLSGGLDSVALIYRALNEGLEPVALFVDWGQRALEEETEAVLAVADSAGVDLFVETFRMDFVTGELSPASKANPVAPATVSLAEQEKSTTTPNRNMILLSMAVARAWDLGIPEVWIGTIGGTEPDCSPAFVEHIARASEVASRNQVTVKAPFGECKKEVVVQEAQRLHVPINLTWSCLDSGPTPCGVCITCVARKEAGLPV